MRGREPNPARTTLAAADNLGTFSCDDAASAQDFGGRILSDRRVHANPAVPGFDASVGSAPDWHALTAGGGFCVDDLHLTLTTTGGGTAPCYRLTVTTNLNTASVHTFTATTSGHGTASITQLSSAYSDNSTMAFEVQRTCPSATNEAVDYTVTGHL